MLHPKPETIGSDRTVAGKLQRKLLRAGGLVFPADDWDVPMLMPEWQATGLELPLDAWGSKAKKRGTTGTFHFYQDDYKFTQLLSNPMALPALYPKASCELNFSTDLNTPLAYLMGLIYAKRWTSRVWQSEAAIRIWVDVNFAAEQAEWQLLGVPKGWRAYSTRGCGDNFRYNLDQWEMACDRAGTKEIVFLVVGGGRKIKEQCTKRGWIWAPSFWERATGKFEGEVQEEGKDGRQE